MPRCKVQKNKILFFQTKCVFEGNGYFVNFNGCRLTIITLDEFGDTLLECYHNIICQVVCLNCFFLFLIFIRSIKIKINVTSRRSDLGNTANFFSAHVESSNMSRMDNVFTAMFAGNRSWPALPFFF